jgi:hypothetical protein
MSASGGEKVIALITFVLIGIPTGLCSTIASPFVIGEFFSLRLAAGAEAFVSALLLLLVWLLGFAIAFVVIRWLARTFSA